MRDTLDYNYANLLKFRHKYRISDKRNDNLLIPHFTCIARELREWYVRE